jgi:hypothetical protein
VAVHGINTHSPTQWEAYKNHKDDSDGVHNWLEDSDMLPAAVPEASIWTFHYEVSWLADGPFENLVNIANKLLDSLSSELFPVKNPQVLAYSIFS